LQKPAACAIFQKIAFFSIQWPGGAMTPNISSNHRHRDDALAIFRAALAAVSPEAAIRRHLDRSGNTLVAAGKRIDLNRVDRIIVVGAGKATAPMAKAIEELVGERIAERCLRMALIW